MPRGQGRPYVGRGKVIDELARERDVRGPHRIAHYMLGRLGPNHRLGKVPTGGAVAKWMYGDAAPTPEKIQMFAEAFDLNEKEKIRLALAHAYGTDPEDA